jgi:hypothetical protein
MATRAKITPSLLAAVMRRRARGDEWKVIARDLRDAGLPAVRETYWRAANREHAREKTRAHVAALRARRKQHREAGALGE